MHLNDLKTSWEHFAEEDAMWAILTDPQKKGNKWTREEFFASGQADIDGMTATWTRCRSGFFLTLLWTLGAESDDFHKDSAVTLQESMEWTFRVP